MGIFTPADRDATLARAVELLEADSRVEAAVFTGSIGRGQADEWSDFDLVAVVAQGTSAEKVADDWNALAYLEWPVIHHYQAAFGTTLVRGYLLANGLLADLAFTPEADFAVWAPVSVAFDRSGAIAAKAAQPQSWAPTPDWGGEAGLAFHDVLHACAAANRGKPWQSMYYLQRIRMRTLGLASERHGWDAEEFDRVDDLPASERDPLLGTLVADLERRSLLDAIDVATRAFLKELRRGSPHLAARLEEPLLGYVAASTAD